jgi:hypothetical protein
MTKPKRNIAVRHVGKLVIAQLRKGAPTVTAAARLAGARPELVLGWLARGRGTHNDKPSLPEYVEFLDKVEQARDEYVQEQLGMIQAAGQEPKHWTALAWILERTRPELFAKRQVIHADGPMEKSYNFLEPAIPEPEARTVLDVTTRDGNGNGDTNGHNVGLLGPAPEELER